MDKMTTLTRAVYNKAMLTNAQVFILRKAKLNLKAYATKSKDSAMQYNLTVRRLAHEIDIITR